MVDIHSSATWPSTVGMQEVAQCKEQLPRIEAPKILNSPSFMSPGRPSFHDPKGCPFAAFRFCAALFGVSERRFTGKSVRLQFNKAVFWRFSNLEASHLSALELPEHGFPSFYVTRPPQLLGPQKVFILHGVCIVL